MLINVSVQNFKSFDDMTELSMISSSKERDNKKHRVKIKQANILKHGVVYGANASGKSNLVTVFKLIKATLHAGLPIDSINDFCRNKEENKEKESIFEIQFTVEDKFYAYGFSAILSERRITEEWLYELLQDGSSNNLFLRNADSVVNLGETVKANENELNRFLVYAEDFKGNSSQLFLAEMNRGKKYEDNSKLRFFESVFNWINNNIIVIDPNNGISSIDTYYNAESLEKVSELIKTFDTGITNVSTRIISIDEFKNMVPADILSDIFDSLRKQMQETSLPKIQVSLRANGGFFNVRIIGNKEPEISTLVLKHGNSFFDYSFGEESDGTRRLFDLIDILVTKREDTIFVIDELERSLHPKLTERFLEYFMEAHKNTRMQMLFTTHENSIMNQGLFRRDEIWFVERDSNNASNIYSLDKFKERYDKDLSKAYLDGRYGAIPVFKSFSFDEEGD